MILFMKKTWPLIGAAILLGALTFSCKTTRNNPFWSNGKEFFEIQELFSDERFPNVVVATDGTVVASWGRENYRVRRSEDGGLILFKGGDHAHGRKQEDARIPEISFRDIALGGRQIRRFHEGIDMGNIRGAGGLARPDIAVSRFRPIRPDSEQHEITVPSSLGRGRDRLLESRTIADHVVGRHNEDDGVGIFFGGKDRCDSNRRRGVPAERLKHDPSVVGTDFPQLLGNHEAMLGIRDDDRR